LLGDWLLLLFDFFRGLQAAPIGLHELDDQVTRARGQDRQELLGEASRRGLHAFAAFQRMRFAHTEHQRIGSQHELQCQRWCIEDVTGELAAARLSRVSWLGWLSWFGRWRTALRWTG